QDSETNWAHAAQPLDRRFEVARLQAWFYGDLHDCHWMQTVHEGLVCFDLIKSVFWKPDWNFSGSAKREVIRGQG
ncbi:unnamed protein product, partial [Urochloa humidicola]